MHTTRPANEKSAPWRTAGDLALASGSGSRSLNRSGAVELRRRTQSKLCGATCSTFPIAVHIAVVVVVIVAIISPMRDGSQAHARGGEPLERRTAGAGGDPE